MRRSAVWGDLVKPCSEVGPGSRCEVNASPLGAWRLTWVGTQVVFLRTEDIKLYLKNSLQNFCFSQACFLTFGFCRKTVLSIKSIKIQASACVSY